MARVFDFFASSQFMPHGHCYLWRPDILWLNVGSDAAIALAYYSIPAALIYFVRKRADVAYPWLLWMFGAFILLCGTTHIVEIFAVWRPYYAVQGLVKLATAGVSAATALLLWPLIPKALALPSPAQLEVANRELRDLQVELEERVRARTAELETANEALRREITERRRVEHEILEKSDRLERSNRELDQFAYVVSHDLKTPLRGIASLSEWIQTDSRDVLGTESREHLELLVQRVVRMGELIDGILQYSRVGHAPPKVEDIDTEQTVREVVESLTVPDGIRVLVDASLPRVCFEPFQLMQVFQNLIDNAIRNLGKPAGTITVFGGDRGEHVEFAVRDDGVGIDARHHERIFRMFQSLRPSSEGGGSGIGLAIVKKMVERHGGRVWVESEVGQGATFRFTVPKAGPASGLP
jgi:signal transduction histidine kinase